MLLQLMILLVFTVRFVNSKNRAALTYRLAVNHLADLDDSEIRLMRGRKYTPGYNGGLPFNKSAHNIRDVPDHIDWRLYGTKCDVLEYFSKLFKVPSTAFCIYFHQKSILVRT